MGEKLLYRTHLIVNRQTTESKSKPLPEEGAFSSPTVAMADPSPSRPGLALAPFRERGGLRILTWNVARAVAPSEDFASILSHVRGLDPAPHAICLQATTRAFAKALAFELGIAKHHVVFAKPRTTGKLRKFGTAVLTDNRTGAMAIDAMEIHLPGNSPRAVACVCLAFPEASSSSSSANDPLARDRSMIATTIAPSSPSSPSRLGVGGSGKFGRAGIGDGGDVASPSPSHRSSPLARSLSGGMRQLSVGRGGGGGENGFGFGVDDGGIEGTHNARAVWVCSAHLDDRFEAWRLMQVKEISRRMKLRGPHVLAGDFNAHCSADFEGDAWVRLRRDRFPCDPARASRGVS